MRVADAEQRIPAVLAIAGSDSGGGAGIQADLKAFARCGVHGMTAITALTAQNTVGVEWSTRSRREMIVAQVEAVAADIGVDAVKIGMLGDEPTIDAVVEALALVGGAPVVVDPVMVSESGATLLEPKAKRRADRAHPAAGDRRHPEPARGAGAVGAGGGRARRELGEALLALGPDAVVVTGGHATTAPTCCSRRARPAARIEGPRSSADGAAHGSGCTHSAALAALLARRPALGRRPLGARDRRRGGRDGLRELGAGPGPVDALGIARRGGNQGAYAGPGIIAL